MTLPLKNRLTEILTLTRAGKLHDATAIIRGSLGAPDLGAATHAAPARGTAARVWRSLPAPLAEPLARGTPPRDTGERLVRNRHATPRGALDYLLYAPASAAAPMPLVIMLHGCTQSAEDFARGTRMDERAEERGFIVAYPEQTQAANAQKCWNWFRPGDQAKDRGEPALIAGITRDIIANHNVDPARVYIAGLSAGGAAAAVMAEAYPDLYAAAGIHSGLACGSAQDVISAFAAMKGNGNRRPRQVSRYVPVITFHGDRDTTVHPDNSEQIHGAWAAAPEAQALTRKVEQGVSAGGRSYRKTALVDAKGRSFAESFAIEGAGHAWAGGSPAGSYTDASGPDASREMLRFFLQHRLAG
ncbi:MAG: hypothetical protein B7Z08_04870 [Sphingomonadales bacterium 32-68-7]|nr:MAG: hypothetical protein B7Z33_08875 [Sphingomonadales bacterium 12-68-11]OYX09565.1 MAG: hypothetical protein B7Z08_04870 [Sphingomonadales bacterium 32-68-7]